MKNKKEILKKFEEVAINFNSDPEVLEHLKAIADKFKAVIGELSEFMDSHANIEDFKQKALLSKFPKHKKITPIDSIMIAWILRTQRWSNPSIFTQMLHRIFTQDSYDNKYKCDMENITQNEESESEFLRDYPNWYNRLLEEMDNDE